MPSILLRSVVSHTWVPVPATYRNANSNGNKMPASPSLSHSLARACPRFFCNYMQLPFVILCKQCLQHTNARSGRSNNTTTNEWTKRITTAQNDCEKCFTHVKCTHRARRRRFHSSVASRWSHYTWIDVICEYLPHVNWTVHRIRMRYKLFFFFFFLHLLRAPCFACVRHQVNAKHDEIKIQHLNRM